MYPVTDRFLTRLAESHTPVTKVELFLTDGRVIDVEHTGGSVSVDRSQAIRRTCSVTCADVSLIPRTASDKLAVYGAKLRISRGVDYGDGSQELVPLGVFRLDSNDGDPSDGPATLTGKDQAAIVADDKFTETYTATGTVVGAVTALIQRSIPDAGIVSLITDTPIGSRAYDIEADPWAGAQEIAAAAGAEVYCNADGAFVISTLPDLLTATPVWEVAAGEGGVYVSGSAGMTADSVFNGVLARGENTSDAAAPVSALVYDNDPGSPTYWGGPFGRRPKFISSSAYVTVANCTQAATVELIRAKAPNSSGDFSSFPNPALEPGDVLRVVHPDGTRELHQVAGFTVPLDEGGEFAISTISAKEDA